MCKVSSRSVPTVIKIKYFVPDLWTKLENTFSYQEWQINPNDFPNRQTNKTTGTQRLTLQVSRHCGMFWKRTDSHKPPLFNFCDRIPITRGSITFTQKILQPFYHNVSFVLQRRSLYLFSEGLYARVPTFIFLLKPLLDKLYYSRKISAIPSDIFREVFAKLIFRVSQS